MVDFSVRFTQKTLRRVTSVLRTEQAVDLPLERTKLGASRTFATRSDSDGASEVEVPSTESSIQWLQLFHVCTGEVSTSREHTQWTSEVDLRTRVAKEGQDDLRY